MTPTRTTAKCRQQQRLSRWRCSLSVSVSIFIPLSPSPSLSLSAVVKDFCLIAPKRNKTCKTLRTGLQKVLLLLLLFSCCCCCSSLISGCTWALAQALAMDTFYSHICSDCGTLRCRKSISSWQHPIRYCSGNKTGTGREGDGESGAEEKRERNECWASWLSCWWEESLLLLIKRENWAEARMRFGEIVEKYW